MVTRKLVFLSGLATLALFVSMAFDIADLVAPLGVAAVALVAWLVLVAGYQFVKDAFLTVQEGTVAVIERFGAYHRIAQPGLGFLLPGVDSVRARIPTSEMMYELPQVKVMVGSTVPVTVEMTVRYQIARTSSGLVDEGAVYRAAYAIRDWEPATQMQALATLHSVLGEMKLRGEFLGVPSSGEIPEQFPRSFVNARLRAEMNRETEKWGISVDDVYLKILEMDEGIRQSLFAERSAARKANIARIQADGDHDVAVRKAEAEARKIDTLSKAIKSRLTPADVIAMRYVEAIEKMVGDPSTKVLMPYDILRTLGEVTRSAQDTKAVRGPALSVLAQEAKDDRPIEAAAGLAIDDEAEAA